MKPLQRLRRAVRENAERVLLGAAALALALTFFHPGWPAERDRFDEVVVLDITQSMNVQDQRLEGKPASRLAFAKATLRRALLALPCGSKIGWGIFTEYRSFLLFAPVEVCANLSELRATLDGIDGRMAWTGNSEIAKGLHSGLAIVRELPEHPALVFVTDGQEAPPVDPRRRPAFDDKAGEVPALIVGVGELQPSPIPKTDPAGRPIGFWRADEVVQSDPRSRFREGSVAGEKLLDDGSPAAALLPGTAPGAEHLSALNEGYLRLLANEHGVPFHRLVSTEALAAAMTAPLFARPATVRADGRVALAAAALVLLLARLALPLARRGWRRRRGGAGSSSTQNAKVEAGPDGVGAIRKT